MPFFVDAYSYLKRGLCMDKLRRINFSFYIGLFFVLMIIFIAIMGPKMAPHTLNDQFELSYIVEDGKGTIIGPPIKPFETKEYPLGTDIWGYDLLTLLLHGAKYTLAIAGIVAIFKIIFGVIIGLYLGFVKRVSSWWLAVENTWSYIPVFLIVYFCLKPVNFSSINSFSLIMYFVIVTTLISLPSVVSSVRKQTLEYKEAEYITVSQSLGSEKHRLIWKHIFPQMKEGLIILFVLEVVYIMTIMGQLGIFNIFIGGTKVTYDPIIYASRTHEWAGIVGQGRNFILGDQFLLIIPLVTLLLATLSFSLLARGLKNDYQANIQKTPWIPTGQTYQLEPQRTPFGQNKFKVTPRKIILVFYLLIFFSAMIYVY